MDTFPRHPMSAPLIFANPSFVLLFLCLVTDLTSPSVILPIPFHRYKRRSGLGVKGSLI
jgi:hypothetical protein